MLIAKLETLLQVLVDTFLWEVGGAILYLAMGVSCPCTISAAVVFNEEPVC